EAVCEVIWLRRILEGLGIPQDKPTTMYVDNEGVLKLVRNPVFHERTKHIEVQVHFIRKHVLKHNIQLHFCPTAEQRADIFTKSLARDKFRVVQRISLLISSENAQLRGG
ncbi:hypothetical protein KI387_041742, partial [Taxus chinensis]